MDSDNHKLFLKLILENQSRIYSYILSLVPSYSDADDILQNAFEAMWRRFDQFEPGSNFLSWALRFTHFEILCFRKDRSRSKEKVYDSEAFELIMPVVEQEALCFDARQEALEYCIDKLEDKQREIIKLRYSMDASPQEISSKLGYKASSIYKIISRIHNNLLACIERKIESGKLSGNG